jgi:predicted nucleic acid-binding protein
VLVDTSVWIEVLRGRRQDRLMTFVSPSQIVTCLPVIQEVLQGFDSEHAFRTARISFASIRVLEPAMTRELYDHAIDLYRRARQAGVTVRSSVDCLIAACAIRNSVAVLHMDRDFDALTRVTDLVATRFE